MQTTSCGMTNREEDFSIERVQWNSATTGRKYLLRALPASPFPVIYHPLPPTASDLSRGTDYPQPAARR